MGRRVQRRAVHRTGRDEQRQRGRANPSIGGGSGLDNQYVIDGVNVTNTGYGALGSYSIVFGSLGNGTPFDFIQEVQVKTGGYEAEFGQATGGVVNVVTKSGSNLRGIAVRLRRPSGARERTGSSTRRDQRQRADDGHAAGDGGAEGGGPVLNDKLFFFGAIDPSGRRARSRR